MEIRVIGAHNFETRETRHTCFIIDGVIAIDAGSIASGCNLEQLNGLEAILLTHRHFDHVRDLPTIGIATLENGHTIDVYSLVETVYTLKKLMDGSLYPDFTRRPSKANPKFKYHEISSGKPWKILEYDVMAVDMPHAAPTVGYMIKDSRDVSFGYTGDTSGRLNRLLDARLNLLAIEITFSNKNSDRAEQSGHLTPGSFRAEIIAAQSRGVNLPNFLVVHRNIKFESEIVEEMRDVASDLNLDVTMGEEDMVVSL